MKTRHINPEQKIHELQQEIANQKEKLLASALELSHKIDRVTTILKLARRYPLQVAGVVFIGGFIISQILQKHANERFSDEFLED